jgi:hypothetical protein
MENLPPIMDHGEAINALGQALTAFLKSGPQYPNHLENTHVDISKSVQSIIPSVSAVTAQYESLCRDFVNNVIEVRGMPTRVIAGSNENHTQSVSSSGSHIAQIFDTLLPLITERSKWCVENYRCQAEIYLSNQISQFQVMLREFLEKIPVGGTKDKTIKSEIVGIKKELRYLVKWNNLFYTYKARSLCSEIENIFALAGNPLAVIWRYSNLDAQGEYQKTYSHEERADKIYAIRRSWAIEKGLIKVGPAGYLDEINKPGQELGCMCSLQWVFSVRRLPDSMITPKGRSELDRVAAFIQSENQAGNKHQSSPPETGRNVPKSKLLRWLGFRGS